MSHDEKVSTESEESMRQAFERIILDVEAGGECDYGIWCAAWHARDAAHAEEIARLTTIKDGKCGVCGRSIVYRLI